MLADSNCGWSGDITFCSENTALIIKLVLILHEGAHYVLLILVLLALLEQFMVSVVNISHFFNLQNHRSD